MELRQLRYFTAIARCGSFSKAAEEVFIAQSALSHQLAQLEGELDTPLFHRSRRGVELTDAGRIFHAHAKAILRQVEDAKASVRVAEGEPSGKVVFGIPHSVSNALALPLLMALRQALPKVDLELTEELTGNLVPQLRSGQISLAVLFDDGTLDEFDVMPLIDEQLFLIGASSLQFPAKRSIGLKQALQMPLILPAHPHGVRPIIEKTARLHGLPPPNVAADISSISILRTTLLAGLGYTLLPVMPLQHDIESGALRAVPLERQVMTRRLMVCAAKHIPLSAASLAVSKIVVNLVNQLVTTQAWKGASIPRNSSVASRILK